MLASASPRRRQLLERAGLDHRVFDAGFEDDLLRLSEPTTPALRVAALAWAKAVAARDRLAGEAALETGEALLAADTLCEVDGRVLGKPRDAADATCMLGSLAGREHRTMTAICPTAWTSPPGATWLTTWTNRSKPPAGCPVRARSRRVAGRR